MKERKQKFKAKVGFEPAFQPVYWLNHYFMPVYWYTSWYPILPVYVCVEFGGEKSQEVGLRGMCR